MKTTPVSLIQSQNITKSPGKKIDSETSSESFSKILAKSIEEVNKLQKQADKAIEKLATGEAEEISQAMIAMEKANLSFQLMTQVRNKIVEAYKEIMRMPV
ncbi:TPA: flagellar hook-basal body complex protein FliE [Candidatus Poribacteria bacterium]|nr:flagellar hook-basal body complex protein FliE [Candidatus Poribacteria bacterium]